MRAGALAIEKGSAVARRKRKLTLIVCQAVTGLFQTSAGNPSPGSQINLLPANGKEEMYYAKDLL